VRFEGQVLIFDADDTLWENNILFERVINDFLDWMEHPTLDRAEIRRIVDDIEAANAAAHGYGSKIFLRSLRECLEQLRERPATAQESRQIEELAVALLEHRIDLIPGVADTLAALGERHDLLLLTKGDLDEQQRKIEVSALARHFRDVHIVPEKNVEVYQWLTEKHALTPANTWMIGNSPKSDILPARQAGMNAVFIPNENTWRLEVAVLDPTDEGVLHVRRFPELLDHF
jgi:putative hydrolase of the HAD superfamily